MKLHPSNKTEYKQGDEVEFLVDGNPWKIYKGKVIGIAIRDIIDHWIVDIGEIGVQFPDWKFSAITVMHTFMRKSGDNRPFLCED